MDNTIILQGKFTSDGQAKNIVLRSGCNWMEVINYTQMGTQQNPGRGVKFEWQEGMAAGTGVEIKKGNASDALSGVTLASGGFTVIDTSLSPVGALDTTVTAVSNAAPPVVTCTSTAALNVGDVVRMIDVAGAQQLGGIDFTIGNGTFTGTTFSLDYMAQIVAGTTGSFRRIKYDPIFYPRNRYISDIASGSTTEVTLTVTHNYSVGQQVRFIVPAEYAMVEINGLSGTIISVDTSINSITVDIDSSAFTGFQFPLTAEYPFTPAQVIPYGEAANANIVNPNLLTDATENQSFIGMQLAAGAQSPAGSNNDVIYWRAGKSFSVDNS